MMKFNRRAIGWLALGMAVTISACTDVGQVSDVETRPAYGNNEGGGGGGAKVAKLVKLHTPAEGTTGSLVVNREGGTLQVAGHMLYIPKNTVSKQTVFIMTVVAGEYIHVDLQAFRKSDGASVTQFRDGVWLGLSYAGANEGDRPLTVSYLVDGTVEGGLEPVPSYTYPSMQMVWGSLNHFSGYAAAID
jgi:hypothetical protein